MLIDLVRSGALHSPDQALICAPDHTLTYADCLAQAEALARGLQARSIERFGCAGTATDLMPLLAASTITGAEACVYPGGLQPEAIDEYASMLDHRVVVMPASAELASADVVTFDALASDDGDLPPPPERTPALILTTGTTGKPRAVRHDWRRLVGAVKHPDPQPGARWFFAYNQNQFAGVQVLLHVLVSRATLIAPITNQPREAAGVMREFGVTHISATPTFWRFVVGLLDEATAATLHLEQITLGGEAVPGPLLERIRDLFPSARVSQVYAANEFGSTSSVKDGRSGLPISVLDRGEDADVQMRIVDGELHVRSRIGMLGYYGEEDISDDWRPTGDLVEVEGDRIVFVGRTSEIINVGGVKVHPLPVEEIVQALDGVDLVHAYGKANPVTGQIVSLDVVAHAGTDEDDLKDRIKAACEVLQPAARPRRIRIVEELDVKGSKIVRNGQER